jgi:formate dehydrogenase beta subunit
MAGHKVAIYDEQSAPGGMALVGVPSYRLPRDILSRESDLISGLGIEVKQGTRIGRDISVQQLSDQGFRAIFIATGAHRDREVDIENWNGAYDGVVEGIQFLRDVNLGKKTAPKTRAIIVGGGNVAVDCARTCVRLGCKEVTIVYRRSRTEMPGRADEIEQAEREGVKLQFLAVPVRVLNKGNKVVGAECIRMALGEPDASGRRRPVPVKGSEFVIDTDMIISAIGEMPDVSFLSGDKLVKTTGQGTIVVDLSTCQTSTPGIFAGGDCVTGPATLIEAIAAGNRAARSIDQYLRTGKVSRSDEDIIAEGVHQVALDRQRQGNVVARRARRSPEQLPLDGRKRNFEEVEQCLTTQAATQEAERCLRCYRVMLMSLAGEK